ncbi:MAG TPA: hypothetical protein VHT21_15080 [Stellaceae bacterium]|jgi:hypothetical protein|nr:hypothetical protein [Stellaceae bacterium]
MRVFIAEGGHRETLGCGDLAGNLRREQRAAEELCFEMSFAPGDIQFVNNHVIYDARSAFEDDDEGHDRLLLRLWLSMPNSRTLPAGHEVLWRATEAGALRGGIGQSGIPV